MTPEGAEVEGPAANGAPAQPTVSLPKGGGAIRGIGEKFGANPATGTGSMSVPIATSPGRDGFGPKLSLSYDSGMGNGPFGFGWSLELPAISRKTDRGLPLYRDAEESDVYLIAGAEDLVPVLREDGSRHVDEDTAPGYAIHRYRPRVEGLFARIERWTEIASGEIYWRTISRDNVTSLYGVDDRCRVRHPDVANGGPARVFKWLICQSYDAKGNAMVYEYAVEDGAGVDPTVPHERNRTDAARSANRYLKRIKYGNRVSRLVEPDLDKASWLFEVVFDYDEGHCEEQPIAADRPEPEQHRFVRASASAARPWTVRPDPFSSHRAGFEVRTYRRCHRVLTFHHIPDLPTGEPGYDGLVRSTEFGYEDLDIAGVSIEAELAHPGSTRFASFIRTVTEAGYVRQGDGTHLRKTLPPLELSYSQAAIDERVRELDRESAENLPAGLSRGAQLTDLDGEGIAGVLIEDGPAWFCKPNLGEGRLGPLEVVTPRPVGVSLAAGRERLLDLAGDGRLDVVTLDGPVTGFRERREDGGWEPLRPFEQLPNLDWDDPNLRFVDLDGDGHADVLITEGEALTWHRSLAESGFGPAQRVAQPASEERGPRLVFADGTDSIYLADMCGDGLADLVRIRNGEVCYWPSLGRGRFGARVVMDNSPWFEEPDQFDQRRVRLADIDGSGANDVIYLGRDCVRLYFNQSGNRLSAPRRLAFPHVDDLSSVTVADLLGNGTACLVWSSPLPAHQGHLLRYVDLMGGTKPHLLVGVINNLGAETRIGYTSSTRFYLADKLAGNPWVTRLPFPVHVVERVVIEDRVSRNRFETRYAYHHGHFDGAEREFRGFGMVEQWDTARFEALAAEGAAASATNVEEASHQPPALTKTWFHTGAPGPLDGAVLPGGLSPEEEREARRALRGSMLRQELYALDDSDRKRLPYTVTEQSFGVCGLQGRGANRHAVFLKHPRESVVFHYERQPTEARVGHVLTLVVDEYGNPLRTAAIGYGRRDPDPDLPDEVRERQQETFVIWKENRFTEAVDRPHDHHLPLPCESREYQLTGLKLPKGASRFGFEQLRKKGETATVLRYEEEPSAEAVQKRLIERVRTYYRCDDLAGPLGLGELHSRALPHESQRLALTPQLLARAYGGRADGVDLAAAGGYVHSEGDANWWIPSGRVFYSEDPAATPAEELAQARAHFFLPRRFRDPFHSGALSTESFASYDAHDLLMLEKRDALDNRVSAAERDPDPRKPPLRRRLDYRVLQPAMVMDANRNRTEVAFDALGMVTATAVRGKPEEAPARGDRLDADLVLDCTEAEFDAFFADPTGAPARKLLGGATSRFLYDLDAYASSPDPEPPRPAVVASLRRETHLSEVAPGGEVPMQVGFAYSDGFDREIQRKLIAEPDAEASPRWACSGWTVFDNKAKPVRQFEPFFTAGHEFEFDVRAGVSPVFLYDPVGRLVATLRPDHTWDKTIFHPWRQETWDVNDTVLVPDPREDADVGDHFARLPAAEYLPTWHALRTDPGQALAASQLWPDPKARAAERRAAEKAAVHAATPMALHVDANGRTIFTVAQNRAKYSDSPPADPPLAELHTTRTVLDVEGNRREALDSRGRLVERCEYDMLGSCLHRASMDAGERWTLNDVTGRPIFSWDSRGHRFRTVYDALRRPTDVLLRQGGGAEWLIGRKVYGESQPGPERRNQRGQVVNCLDQAGVVSEDEYDFKGNCLSTRRRLARDYRATLDWSGQVALEEETYVSRSRYDALNRPIQVVAPHSDRPGTPVNVIQPTYNEANLLEAMHAWLGQAAEPTGLLDSQTATLPAVTGIEYDAKGRRRRVAYGNGAVTSWDFDRLTSRLRRLQTRRDPAAFPDDCPAPPPADWPGCALQSLHYSYDPVGNVSSIRDEAQQAIFFRNRRVEPDAEYTYDAAYRLIEASGREHLGQVGGAPVPSSYNDAVQCGAPHPSDGQAMGAYLERYVYDAVGNLLRLQHRGSDAGQGWTRSFSHDEASATEPSRLGNRLTASVVAGVSDVFSSSGDGYDAHGNLLRMPHLQATRWGFRDELRMTSRQAIGPADADGLRHDGERTWFAYDAGGARVRKVTESSSGQVRSERIYIGGFEIYRRHASSPLERQTLHLLDGEQRFALVEMRTEGDDDTPAQLVRYQLGNHLGSASVELDQGARVISYAEYTPYGSTSYQAVRGQVEAPRYRYTAKERDEESGLYHFGARYYAPWLGRWLGADPAGISAGVNLYAYCRGNPVTNLDPDGRDGQSAQPSAWNRFAGGMKALGGAAEIVAGASLMVSGATALATGVGIPAGIGMLAGGFAAATHGSDTLVSGALTAWSGTEVDSLGSQALQEHAGFTKGEANMADAGVGIAASVGTNLLTKAPQVVSVAARTPSITVVHEAGAVKMLGMKFANPVGYVAGHSRVGVTTSEGMTWSHLVVDANVGPSAALTARSGTLKAVVETGEIATPGYASSVTIPLTEEGAQAARLAMGKTGTRAADFWVRCGNDCATYTVSVLKAAGVTASGKTPPGLFVSAALRSEQPMTALLTAPVVVHPAATTAGAIHFAEGVAPPIGSRIQSYVTSGVPGALDPAGFRTFDQFQAAAGPLYTQDFLMESWASVHGPVSVAP